MKTILLLLLVTLGLAVNAQTPTGTNDLNAALTSVANRINAMEKLNQQNQSVLDVTAHRINRVETEFLVLLAVTVVVLVVLCLVAAKRSGQATVIKIDDATSR